LNSLPMSFNNIVAAIPPGYNHIMKFFNQSVPVQLIELEGTKGPAHTLLEVIQRLPTKEAMLVLDVDVVNHHRDLYRLAQLAYCGVLVSYSANPMCSYVSNPGLFKQIKEKKPISDYAVRGAYWIPTNFVEVFETWLQMVVEKEKEPYISQVLARMSCEKFALQTIYEPVDFGTITDVKKSGAQVVHNVEEKDARYSGT